MQHITTLALLMHIQISKHRVKQLLKYYKNTSHLKILQEKANLADQLHVANRNQLPYLPDYKPQLFFQKFQGSGLYSGATYVRTFPRNHALHTARYGVPRSALDHDQLTHSAPQSLSLQSCGHPSPARRVSLSLCPCMRPSTARTGRAWENSRLKSRAEHAALSPRWQ